MTTATRAEIGDLDLFLPGVLLESIVSHDHPLVVHDLQVPQVRPMLCHVEHGRGGELLSGTSFLRSREGVSLRSASAVFRRRERGGL
jgi:hypothetical protein